MTISKQRNTCAQVPVRGFINVRALSDAFGLAKYQVIANSIGNDNRILLLLAKSDQTGASEYQAISIGVDWLNGGVLFQEVTDFGCLPHEIHFIQTLEDGFLLLGSRSQYFPKGKAEKNALFTDGRGQVTASYCFGDGINRCLVDRQQRIVTGYFDEGVFGNYGWNDPIGSSGIITWSAQGQRIWENHRHDICDCYALNIDNNNNLWFYYYTEFNLVKTNYKGETVFVPGIDGCTGFLFNIRNNFVLFDAGYDRRGEFEIMKLDNSHSKLSPLGPAAFCWNGSRLDVQGFHFRASKALLWNNNEKLYYTEWREG